MISTKQTYILLMLFCTVISLIPAEGQDETILILEATDEYLKQNQADVIKLFGKGHLSFNHKSKQVKQVEPLVWGQHHCVLAMLQVKYHQQNCTSSRNVVFLLDTGTPFTVISLSLKQMILVDCGISDLQNQKYLMMRKIKINGRQITPQIANPYNANINILGMDYMIANNIQFTMKLNKYSHRKSALTLNFDINWNDTDL